MNRDLVICIVGAGGIGSHLTWALVPAIHRGRLIESIGPVKIRIFDSDLVSQENISHQRFAFSDIGKTKVESLRESLSGFESESLSIEACPWDIRETDDLGEPSMVVVGVDSPTARFAVHGTKNPWLDLRCAGDCFVALDNRMAEKAISSLTDEAQNPGSCQMEGAVDSGNIQFGHVAAAAHGAQWVVQKMRIIDGQVPVMAPLPKSSSITFGTLEGMEISSHPLGDL